MFGGTNLVESMGLALDGKKIGSKLGGAVWCNDFREGFACGDIRARKKA